MGVIIFKYFFINQKPQTENFPHTVLIIFSPQNIKNEQIIKEITQKTNVISICI